MKRTQLALLVVSFAALLNLPTAAHARGSSIAKSLGNLRWGMSEMELRTALKSKIGAGELRALSSSHVAFDGGRTRWDSSPVAEEYTHGNDETMLTYTSEDGSENYYFFIGGELWKWVKLYPASTFGRDYKGFARKVQGRFGKGYEKSGEVNPGTGFNYKFIEFLDRNTRLRAVDKTDSHGKFALVFESLETARSISALRGNTIRRATNKAALAKADRREQTQERRAEQAEPPSNSFTLASSKKRSIFADEKQQGESAAAYEARKQRTIEQERAKQRRQHERAEDAKKGKTLDGLADIEDDDPLAGMK